MENREPTLDDKVESWFHSVLGLDLRMLFWGTIGVAFCSAGLWVFLRLQAAERVERELMIMNQQVKEQSAEIAECKDLASKQLTELQTTLYGSLTAQQRRPATAEKWMKNRDAELRGRIAILEQWRYRADAKIRLAEKILNAPIKPTMKPAEKITPEVKP